MGYFQKRSNRTVVNDVTSKRSGWIGSNNLLVKSGATGQTAFGATVWRGSQTGTLSLTSADFEGTPKGVFIWSSAVSGVDSYRNHAQIVQAVADDKDNAYCMYHRASNGVNPSQVAYEKNDSGVLRVGDDTGAYSSDWTANINSGAANAGPVNGGWQIDLLTTPGSEFDLLLHFILFGGDGVECTVVHQAGVPGTDEADIDIPHDFTGAPSTMLGFFFTTSTSVSATGADDFRMGHGIAAYSSGSFTQASAWHTITDNVSPSAGQSRVNYDYNSEDYGCITDAAWLCKAKSVDATNLTLTKRIGGNMGATPDAIGALLIKLPSSAKTWTAAVSAPTTAASDWTPSVEPNFQPDLFGFFYSGNTLNNSAQSTTESGDIGIGFIDSDLNQSYAGCHSLDNETTTASGSNAAAKFFSHSRAATGGSENATFEVDVSANPFTSTGITIPAADISSVDGGAARRMITFAVKF